MHTASRSRRASRATCRVPARSRGSPRARLARGAAVAAERAAPLYLRDKVALTTEERQGTTVSAVPIPQMHYRRMRAADLPEVAHLEKSLYAFPWSIGNFRDSLNAGYDCWTVTPRRGGDRLRDPDDRARRGAPAQLRDRLGMAEPGHRARLPRAHDRGGARRRLPDRLPRGAALERRRRATSIARWASSRSPSGPSTTRRSSGREDALFLGLTL